MAQLVHKVHLVILEYLVGLGIVVLMAHQVTADTQELVDILVYLVNLEYRDIADREYLVFLGILVFLDIAELMVKVVILESRVGVEKVDILE